MPIHQFGVFPIAESVKEFKFDWEKNYLLSTEGAILLTHLKP
jgi:hypothetical protein